MAPLDLPGHGRPAGCGTQMTAKAVVAEHALAAWIRLAPEDAGPCA